MGGARGDPSHYSRVLVKPIHYRKVTMMISGEKCVAEIEAEIPGHAGTVEILDVFTIDHEGRITQLSVYHR